MVLRSWTFVHSFVLEYACAGAGTREVGVPYAVEQTNLLSARTVYGTKKRAIGITLRMNEPLVKSA